MQSILNLFTQVFNIFKGCNLPLFDMNLYDFFKNYILIFLLISIVLGFLFGSSIISSKKK